MASIVTLTTDFGTRDSYVAAMKGVILGIAREARLVDVSHEVAAHDVTEGALALEAAAPFFPAGTVHLAVVDPGVGTERRGLAIVTDAARFVGPDNGLFTPFLEGRDWRAFELTAPDYRLRTVSRTFHGRDVFAPAAAHLAVGLAPGRAGRRERTARDRGARGQRGDAAARAAGHAGRRQSFFAGAEGEAAPVEPEAVDEELEDGDASLFEAAGLSAALLSAAPLSAEPLSEPLSEPLPDPLSEPLTAGFSASFAFLRASDG